MTGCDKKGTERIMGNSSFLEQLGDPDATTGEKMQRWGVFGDTDDDCVPGTCSYAITGGAQTWGWE